jgi:hypothetical protein
MGNTHEIQNQIFFLKITRDSYNHKDHCPPSLPHLIENEKYVLDSLLHYESENKIRK